MSHMAQSTSRIMKRGGGGPGGRGGLLLVRRSRRPLDSPVPTPFSKCLAVPQWGRVFILFLFFFIRPSADELPQHRRKHTNAHASIFKRAASARRHDTTTSEPKLHTRPFRNRFPTALASRPPALKSVICKNRLVFPHSTPPPSMQM